MVFFLDYFTAWTDIIFTCTILFCLCFPGVLPLWFWIGIACLMTSVGVVGSLVFSTMQGIASTEGRTMQGIASTEGRTMQGIASTEGRTMQGIASTEGRTMQGIASTEGVEAATPQHIVGDFMVHILPVIVLFFFYRILEKRFYYSETSILKSALFPAILSIIYICTHNVETVYKSSDLSSFVIIILTVSVWLSSYQIFIPKKCSFIRVKNN